MEKLLAVTGIIQAIYGKLLMRRLVSDMMVIASLIIVASVMAGATLVGGFYAAYLALLHAGLEPRNAMMAISGLAAVATCMLIMSIVIYTRRLRGMPRQLVPVVSELNDAVDAFLEGLMGSET